MIEQLEQRHTTPSEHKTDKRFAIIYGPIVRDAVHGADKFSIIIRNRARYLESLHFTLDLLREKMQLIGFQGSFDGNMLYFAVSGAHHDVVDYMFTHGWLTETLNQPCGPAQRTPVLEAIRWNRGPLFQTLVEHGADIHALAANPFRPGLLNWSALHTFAYEGHNKDVSLVRSLVENGIPVDGPLNGPLIGSIVESKDATSPNISSLSVNPEPTVAYPSETSFAIAVRHNAFYLASTLLSLKADPNALSLSSGLFTSLHPLTILGHVIISNARYSSARLRHLLHLKDAEVDFIVEPSRQLSTLHRAAIAYEDVEKVMGGEVKVEEFDMETNNDIMFELSLKWWATHELDTRCLVRGRTALHFAVEVGNLGTVESLVGAGANMLLEDDDGENALQLAERPVEVSNQHKKILRRLR